MPIISISLTSNLLRKLDEIVENRGYSSRSEAIRDAVRDFMSEFELNKFREGYVAATITVISERKRRDLDEKLMGLRHKYDNIVSTNMHIHLGKEYCLEVFIAKGEVKEILNFISKVRALRGVQQVKYTLVQIKKLMWTIPIFLQLLGRQNLSLNFIVLVDLENL